MIVSLPAGCDNVQWAGAEIELQPPPPSPLEVVPDRDSAAVDGGPELPDEPVLYMVEVEGSEGTLVPVAVIAGDSLRPLPTEEAAPGFRAAFARERMARGSRFVLFAGGSRAGTLVTRDLLTEESFCQPRAAARGPVEIVPQASAMSRFLALSREHAGDPEYGTVHTPETDRGDDIASLNMAGEVIPQVGARWPTSLRAARQDFQALVLAGEGEGTDAFAVTYVFRDEMEIAEAEPSSYALFILGVRGEEEFEQGYVWYREAGRQGRGVPRFFGQADWDRDGESEILLEVLGQRSRWTAALDREAAGEWDRVWQDACGAEAPPVTDREEG